jgi:ubiquinone/menaquinone biosynthesis C-methylase UbiE
MATLIAGHELSKEWATVAPCLLDEPYGAAAREFCQACADLGTGRGAAVLRAWTVLRVFVEVERILSDPSEPTVPFARFLRHLTRVLTTMREAGFPSVRGVGEVPTAGVDGVEQATGEHYGPLFRDFTRTSYWDEPTALLRVRLERNEISENRFASKRVLDAGCGGGRYTVAWRTLGAAEAVGVDISEINIQDASRRVAEAGLTGVEFRQGNALSLPFPDSEFDVVFSNGVLHHTVDWKKGVRELLRVLKPGGLGWLYLIENPGGLFWDSIEILRVVMLAEPSDFARQTLRLLGVPANRVFYMLDHVMVPINLRLTPQEIDEELQRNGATAIRRLTRGTDFDRVEQIHRRVPFAEAKYGVGENRFVFSKC